jgi:pimeloyl-ACP methyl ester carboxylesterase
VVVDVAPVVRTRDGLDGDGRGRGAQRSATAVREGVLPGGLPYLAFGSGPPVVVLAGIDGTGGTTNPTGPMRSLELRPYRPLAEHRTVYLVRRSPGIPAGSTMAALAAQHAAALRQELGEPVDVVGVSTGGSVALQLAVDHPHAVRRLVLLAGACRLSDRGRAVQRVQARLTVRGQHRRAMAVTVPAVFSSSPVRLAMRAMVLLATERPTPQQADDLVRTLEAEDAYDVSEALDRVTAPTLVVGGSEDGYYGPELFTRTAAGIPGGALLLLPGRGHAATMTSTPAMREVVRFLQAPEGAPWVPVRAAGETAETGAGRRTTGARWAQAAAGAAVAALLARAAVRLLRGGRPSVTP